YFLMWLCRFFLRILAPARPPSAEAASVQSRLADARTRWIGCEPSISPAASRIRKTTPPAPSAQRSLRPPARFDAIRPASAVPAARNAHAHGAIAPSANVPRCTRTAPTSISRSVVNRPAAPAGSSTPAGVLPSLVFLIIAHPPAE